MEEGVFGEVDAADDVARLELDLLAVYCSWREDHPAYHDLFSLCKVVPRVPVQLHLAQFGDGHELLGHDLGRVEEVEAEAQLVGFIHDLHAELMLSVYLPEECRCSMKKSSYLPFGKPPGFNSIIKILTHEIRVLTRNLLRLFPYKTGLTLQPLPVEFDKLRGAVVSDQAERVDAETIHMSEGTRDAVSGHRPQERVQGAGLLCEEVPGGVVRAGGLGDFIVAARFDGVD